MDSESQRVNSHHFGSQPMDSQPFDSQPIDSQPFDSQPIDSQPFESQPIDSQLRPIIQPLEPTQNRVISQDLSSNYHQFLMTTPGEIH